MKFSKFLIVFVFLGFLVQCKQEKSENNTEQEAVLYSESKPYMEKEELILSYLTVNEIPEDFPKYIEGEEFKEYKKRCINWAKEHPELVKPQYRQKLSDEN